MGYEATVTNPTDGKSESVPLIATASQGFVSAGAWAGPTNARTADTNAYAANDIIGQATGATAALTFANIGPLAGGEILITTVKFEIDVAAIPSGMTSFRLYLYSVTPPSALGDNVAFDVPSGDRASFKGYIDLGSPVDLGSTLYVKTDGVNAALTVPAGGSLFGYLVTNGGFTPGSADVYKVKLHSVAL